jgi:hypothetical protein
LKKALKTGYFQGNFEGADEIRSPCEGTDSHHASAILCRRALLCTTACLNNEISVKGYAAMRSPFFAPETHFQARYFGFPYLLIPEPLKTLQEALRCPIAMRENPERLQALYHESRAVKTARAVAAPNVGLSHKTDGVFLHWMIVNFFFHKGIDLVSKFGYILL